MKKLLLSLAIVLSMGAVTVYAGEEAPTSPTPEITAGSPAPMQETTAPSPDNPSEEPSVSPTTESTPAPTAESTAAPALTPSSEPSSLPIPAFTDTPSTKAPTMYAIKNGGGISVALRYASGKLSVEKMISLTEEEHSVYTTMFKDGENYLPLRYFFELTEMEEVKNTSNVNNPWKYDDMMSILNQIDNKNAFAYVNDNGIKVAYKRVGEEAKDIDPESSFLADDGHTYVKVRELSRVIGYEVEYDEESGYAYVIMNGNDKFRDEALTAIRNLPNNDNYTTYSDGYINAGAPDFLSKTLGKDIYCVNQIGDLLIYVDNDFRIKYMELSDMQEKNLIIDGVDNDNFFVDLLAFDGNKIYGITVKQGGDYIGQLFSAKLSPTNDTKGFYASEYKVLENAEAAALCIKGDYCYFTDVGDTLKRVNKSDFSNPEILTVDGRPLTKISHYNICGNLIIYRNYGDNKIYTGWLNPDPEDNTKLSSKVGIYSTFDGMEISNVRGIVNDGANTFYFIATDNDNKDSVWGATFVKGENGALDSFTYTEDQIFGKNERIRNIAVLNNNLYATVGNNKDRMPILPSSAPVQTIAD